MIPKRIQCKNCGSDIEVATYRKFTICPYCKTKCDFEGFELIGAKVCIPM